MSIIAKYKFDKSIYENLIPEFNEGYTGYTISDEIDSENSNHVIRTIECDILPTRLTFGIFWVDTATDTAQGPRAQSLLKVYNMNTQNVTNISSMFRACFNVTDINCESIINSDITQAANAFEGCRSLISLDLSNWNTSNVVNMTSMFSDCQSLTSLDVSGFDTSNVTIMNRMFFNCSKLTSLDVSGFNTSKVTNMNGMFCNCKSLTSLDLSGFNTGNVTTMNSMFRNCYNLTSLDVSNFDTSNVTDMQYMFCDCNNLITLNVSNFNTSNVTDMGWMFNNCFKLTSLDVSSFNTGNVINMQELFSGCQSLTSLDVSNFDTSKVTNMKWLFDGDTYGSAIKTVNLNNIVIQDNTNIQYIFSNTPLEKIYLNDIGVLNKLTDKLPDRRSLATSGQIVTTLRDQIDEGTMAVLVAKNWQIKDLVAQYRFDANTYGDLMPEFNPEFTEDMYEVHDSVSNIVIDDIQWEDGSLRHNDGIVNNDNTDEMHRTGYIPIISNTTYKAMLDAVNVFWYDEQKRFISVSTYTSKHVAPTNAKYMRCYQNKHTNASFTAKLVTRSIESKNGNLPTSMIFGNSNWSGGNLTTDRTLSLLKVMDLNSNELITCYAMFHRCERLSKVSKLNITDKCTSLAGMFSSCNKLTSLVVSGFNTSNVTNMDSVFCNCYKLTSLDVSNFDTSNVTNIIHMFNNCHSLTSLDVSGFNTSNVTNMSNMFNGCYKLTSIDVSNFNTSNVTTMDAMFTNCYNLTSLDVSNWDVSKVTNMWAMFYNCNKLTSLDVSKWDVSKVANMQEMFQLCQSLTSLDVSNWNATPIDVYEMFCDCSNLTSLDVSKWNTSKVNNMSNMFNKCQSLTSLDVSNFDTSNVTSFEGMFYNCKSLTSLDLSGWDVSRVNIMREMFAYCTNLTSLDVSNWDTSNVIEMDYMFNNCQSLTSLDVSKWNTSNVTNMYAMFSDCANISSLDITNWDTSNVTNMEYFLDGLEVSSVNIKNLDLSFLELSSVTHIGAMFYKNRSTNIKLPKVINHNLTSVVKTYADSQTLRGMFHCSNLVSLDFGGLDISNVTDDKSLLLEHVPKLRYIRTENAALIADLAQYFPARTEAEQGYLITKASVSNEIRTILAGKYWNVVDLDEVGTDVAIYKFDKSVYKSLVPQFDNNFVDWFMDDVIEDEVNAPNIVTRTIRSMGGLPTLMRFGQLYIDSTTDERGMKRAKSLRYVDYLNTNEITNVQAMFRLSSVVTIAASNFNTSKVPSMNAMFQHCRDLTSLDVSNFNTSNVTNMNCMFQDCDSLTSLDLSNWDTSNVTTMSGMFRNCNKLTSLAVSNFNTSKVTNIQQMFYNCNNLTSLDVSNFNTSKVTTMQEMFYNCKSLTSLDVSNFNTSNVTRMDAMFTNCYGLTSLDLSNFDTSKVTTMPYMFYDCNNLTSVDVSNFNTSNVTNMCQMFYQCKNLTSVDVSNFNTSKVIIIHRMFNGCNKLTSLDVSKWNTSKVYDMGGIFWDCKSLTSLDVSNWDTSSLHTVNENALNHAFCNCQSLTSLDLSSFITKGIKTVNKMLDGCANLETLDISNFDMNSINNIHMSFIEGTKIENIGMIYCDFKTVEKTAANIPLTNHTTLWVGNHIDINRLPQYDHITYKVYEVEDKLEVELSSPLLEGDRLEIIDGNLYHYHKMNMLTVDKNDHDRWVRWTTTDTKRLDEVGRTFFIDNKVANELGAKQYCDGYCSAMIYDGRRSNIDNITQIFDHVRMSCWLPADGTPNHRLYCFTDEKYDNINDFKQYIQKLYPFDVTYVLDKPYYELVKPNVGLLNAEQGLYLNISDSVVPVVNHQDLCTLKLNYLLPNVEYKVKFKANNPGSIAINLGGTLVPLDVVEGWNEVMVNTPETLVDEYLKVNGSEGIKIQNVMVIDSDKDFDYFKGMNNTFDEIPVKNICKNRTLTYTHGVDEEGVSPQGAMNVNVAKGKVVTVVGKVSNNPNNLPISINLYNDTGRATGKNLLDIRSMLTSSIGDNRLIYTTIDNRNCAYRTTVFAVNWDFKPNVKFKENTQYILYYDCKFVSNDERTRSGNFFGFKYTDGAYSTFKNLTNSTINNTWMQLKLISTEGKTVESIIGSHNSGYDTCTTYFDLDSFMLEEGNVVTAYEPPEFNVNENPMFINPDENGNFAITIKADRDYANRIGFNVGDVSSCEANDQVTITDLMVFEGDILDCHPTTYVDPADTRYLVEYKSIGNPFGFGKNKLI